MDTILVIDDDEAIFKLVQGYGKGLNFFYCRGTEEALRYLSQNTPSLILLDVELENESGIDFYIDNHLVLTDLQIPIMMLTRVEHLGKKLEAFELGAVDYILKPFQPMELMARIKLQLKKIPATKELFNKKDIFFEKSSARVYMMVQEKKEKVELSPTEFKLLLFLAENEEQIFSREKLMEKVWGIDLSITDRTVDQHISKLRKKIKSKHFFIKTVHNSGYSFCKLEKA